MVRHAQKAVLGGLAVLLGSVLPGCGGGGSNVAPAGTGSNVGSLSVSVTFPARDRAPLPPEADRVVLAVSGIGLPDAQTQTLTRPADNPDGAVTTTAGFDNIPVGLKQVLATAHTATGSEILAGGFNEVEVLKDQRTAVDVVMTTPGLPRTETATGSREVDGATVTVITQSGAGGEELYLSSGATGIRWHGSLQAGLGGQTELFRPPLLVAPFGVSPGYTGQQTSNIFIGGLFEAQAAVTCRFLGVEGVATPLGAFQAAKVRLTADIHHLGRTTDADETAVKVFWLVENVGPVLRYNETRGLDGSLQEPPTLEVLTASSLSAAASPTRQSAVISPAHYPLPSGATWTFVELEKGE